MSGKQKDSKYSKEKKFLNLPKYPGGSKAFKQFIADNLIYPSEALSHRVEGEVYIKFQVNNKGKVFDAEVLKGIGYGCDEEALRIVKLLQYEAAKNRGVRVTSTMRTRIRFKLPQSNPSYQIHYNSSKAKPDQSGKKKEKPSSPRVYNYTININQQPDS